MIRTVNLETAKKLKDAGFKQDTQYYWKINPFNDEWYITSLRMDKRFAAFSAPTTDELLEELPACVVKEIASKHDVNCWLQIDKIGDSEYYVGYVHSQNVLYDLFNESLPEALSQMWLFLKKEGLLNGQSV